MIANKFDSQMVWSEGYDNGSLCAKHREADEPIDCPPVRNRREWLNALPNDFQELANNDDEQLSLIEEQYIRGCEAGWRDGIKGINKNAD